MNCAFLALKCAFTLIYATKKPEKIGASPEGYKLCPSKKTLNPQLEGGLFGLSVLVLNLPDILQQKSLLVL